LWFRAFSVSTLIPIRPRSAVMFESGPLFIPGPGFQRNPFQRVIDGDCFWAAEGMEWAKWAGLESRPALTERLFQAGLVFISRRSNPHGMDLIPGRSERNERGLNDLLVSFLP
jgi:hypothetical protein